jgi:hypothetical protein
MSENKITLATEIDKDAVFLVDFSKMQSIEDLIKVLAAVGFSFSPYHPHFDMIKHLLALDQPIKVGQKPEEKKLQLPKLKVVKPNGQ